MVKEMNEKKLIEKFAWELCNLLGAKAEYIVKTTCDCVICQIAREHGNKLVQKTRAECDKEIEQLKGQLSLYRKKIIDKPTVEAMFRLDERNRVLDELEKEIKKEIEKLETRISKGIAYDFDKEKLNWTGQIIGLQFNLKIIEEMRK